MTLATFNALDQKTVAIELSKCCGSTRWIDQMIADHPFKSKQNIYNNAIIHWNQHCTKVDWLEAFDHHPKIGDLKNLEKKFANTKDWSGEEQASIHSAQQETLVALAEGNAAYEAKFGYIFIVCATGKSAAEMLALLNSRINNTPETEIQIAMKEQEKITRLRIDKMLQ